MVDFDAKRALLRKPDLFRRFLPGPSDLFLADVKVSDGVTKLDQRQPQLSKDEVILVFERDGERRGLLARQMGYHHVAQGELAGEPYVVTF